MPKTQKITLDNTHNHKWDKAFWAIPGWDPEKISKAKVMVVGAGALGNEVIKNLTLLNVGHILVVDFDLVEFNNLAKSILFKKEDTGTKKAHAIVKNLKDINSNVKTLSIDGDISTDVGLGLFRRMNVVIGCLDNRLARMYINRHCFKVNKSWVEGALENLSGRFSVYTPGKSCYECNLSDAAWDIIRFRMGCPDIVKRNASLGVIATTPVSASIIGGYQVQEALKIIFGNHDTSIAGEGFHYDGRTNFFLKYKEPQPKEECGSHIIYESIKEVSALSHNNTVEEILDWLEEHFETKEIKILVEEDIVLEVVTSKSGNVCYPAIYKNHLMDDETVLQLERAPEEDLSVSKSITYLDRGFPFPKKSLKAIGIPFLDILKVEANNDIHFIELTGDEEILVFT